MSYELVTDYQGRVLEAYYINSKGKKNAVPVFQKGQAGYMNYDENRMQTILIKNDLVGESECYAFSVITDVKKYMEEQGMIGASGMDGYTQNVYFVTKDPREVNLFLNL